MPLISSARQSRRCSFVVLQTCCRALLLVALTFGGACVRRTPHFFPPVLTTQLTAVADEVLSIASAFTSGLARLAYSCEVLPSRHPERIALRE